MKAMSSRTILFVSILALLIATVQPAMAMQTPSKTAEDQSLQQRQGELAEIQRVIAKPEVAEVIAQHGFTTDEVNERLAQLSPEEIHALSSQLDQIHAAGANVPTYVWILVAILLGVLIIGAL